LILLPPPPFVAASLVLGHQIAPLLIKALQILLMEMVLLLLMLLMLPLQGGLTRCIVRIPRHDGCSVY